MQPALEELTLLLPPTFEGLQRDFAVGVVGAVVVAAAVLVAVVAWAVDVQAAVEPLVVECRRLILKPLPAASRMRTRGVWVPGAIPLKVAGEAHVAHVAPSSEHCAAAPSLPRVKLNVATDDAVGEVGPEVMTAVPVGGVVSTLKLALLLTALWPRLAAVVPTWIVPPLSAKPLARTERPSRSVWPFWMV